MKKHQLKTIPQVMEVWPVMSVKIAYELTQLPRKTAFQIQGEQIMVTTDRSPPNHFQI